jgi:hypothetical protein
MEQLNEEYAWIEKEAAIYRIRYGDFIQPDKFRTQLNNRKVLTLSGKLVGAGTAWLDHPDRRQHERIVLRPDEARVTRDNCLNEWSGFAFAPVKGDVRWFLWLLIRLVPDRSARKFIVAWMAHFLQHPAVRNLVALVFWSHQQGVGKNLLFECLASIVGGRHATVIGQEQLLDGFNGWAKNKLIVIGDEVVGTDKRQEGDKLKVMITASTIHINEKYQPAVEMPNLMNFIFLSNHPDAVFMGDADRRFYVNEITSPRLTPAEASEFAFKRDNGGLAALHYWFRNLDVSGFDPKAPAPMTVAKQQMIEDSRSDLESWAVDLLASDLIARMGREVVTANELASRYSAETGRTVLPSSKTVVGVFKKLGAYARPTQIRVATGKKLRVLAIARPDFWKSQSEANWAAEYGKTLR